MAASDLVLVDTCVWVPFFNRRGSIEKRMVDQLLDEDRVLLIGPVLSEVLLGFRRDEQADWVESTLRGTHWLDLAWDDWTDAARLGRGLAKQGHVLPLSDLLIAAAALARDTAVYTTDPHFDLVPKLKRYPTK